MDILGMLENDIDDICQEDLDMIEVELDTGDYDYEYKTKCRVLMKRASDYYKQRVMYEEVGFVGDKGVSSGMKMTKAEAADDSVGVVSPKVTLTALDKFERELKEIRKNDKPIEEFKKKISKLDYFDENFIDTNFTIFNKQELLALLIEIPFSETFLEKYFKVLNAEALARHQQYSEQFFMKHYDELDTKLVLQNKKNEWTSPDKMSKQLSTFLRIKGVRI